MKAYKYISIMLTVLALTACKDELETGGVVGMPGYLTFDLTEGRSWAENGNTRGGAEAPILMDCSLDGEPLYLHTTVQPSSSVEVQQEIKIDDQADTRGIRYTEDVFSISSNGSPKISDFGVYGRTQDGSLTIFDFAQITPTKKTNKDGGVYYDWNVSENNTMFQDWGSGLADFYGYAPYFANPSAANGLRMDLNSQGVPVLTYEVPANVSDQLDILTAKQTGVAKNSNGTVVKLPFDHVMSAIKFNFVKGKLANGTDKTSDYYTWNDGLNTYNITVNTIHINNVYKKGTWTVGDDPYNGGTWSVDTSVGTASFTYSLTKNLAGESNPEVELNPDDGGNVFMMLPQTVPSNATISLDCTLTNTSNSSDTKTATLTASLKTWENGSKTQTPMTWQPGYTYYYSISMSDIEYVFDYNTATAKNYTDVVYSGVSDEDIFIRSYKIDSKGTKLNVDWELQYLDTLADVTGVGQGGGGDQPIWKPGSNGWIHLYDKTGGTYAAANEVKAITVGNETKATHVGANESNTDNEKLFKIEVGTIMTPIYDLSMWNQYQTKRWKGRSTSNCYIVAGPGTYRIPLIYGNAWTKGTVNPVAYNSGLSIEGTNNVLGAFLNAYDQEITSPFIKKDLAHYGHSVKDAVLIWEEGDCAQYGTVTEEMRHSMGGGNGGNEGTVVKVISTIDTEITGEDTYNANNSTAGTQTGCDYLQFEVKYSTFNYGNAVVGIRDENNNIVWSWHIWMVNADDFVKDNVTLNLDNNTITYANTNIGWVDGGKTVLAEKRKGKERLVQAESGRIITIDAMQEKRRQFTTYFTNVLYQWGRKDPIRGNVNAADMQKDWGAPRGEAGVTSYATADFNISPGLGIYGQKRSVGGMIQTPNTAWGLSDGDLYTTVYYNLWASKLKKVYNTNGGTWVFYGKTIYDPSPVGYCVPPSKCLTKLARSGFADVGASASLPIVCYYNSTLPFHASGIRTTTAGYDLTSRGYHQPGTLNAANGFYHTATPYSNDECWQLHLYFYPGTDTHNFIRGDMCEALSVKPVLWNGEAVDTEEPDQDKEYLTFTFLESGRFYWVDSHITQTSRTIQWTRTPKDESSWQNVTSSYDSANDETLNTHEGTRITEVSSGDKIYVRGTNSTYCIKSAGTYYYNYFRTTGAYELSGNIMSLTWGSEFDGKTEFRSGSTFTFCSLFYNPQFGANTNRTLESVDGLVLPATTLVQSCYESMFDGCEGLITAPYLPATVGATDCYKNMYKDCSHLTTVKSSLEAPSSNYTSGWVNGVANTGTFFYKSGATWPSGADGIPSGWDSYAIYD